MRINQGIDLFDFLKIICLHVITNAWLLTDLEDWFLERRQTGIHLSVCPLPRIHSLQLIAWFGQLMCGFPWNPHSFLREVSAKVFDCFVPKHTQRQKHVHVSIALFDHRVCCHSGVRRIIHYSWSWWMPWLSKYMSFLNWVNDNRPILLRIHEIRAARQNKAGQSGIYNVGLVS